MTSNDSHSLLRAKEGYEITIELFASYISMASEYLKYYIILTHFMVFFEA